MTTHDGAILTDAELAEIEEVSMDYLGFIATTGTSTEAVTYPRGQIAKAIATLLATREATARREGAEGMRERAANHAQAMGRPGEPIRRATADQIAAAIRALPVEA